jgi:hypothetical protein
MSRPPNELAAGGGAPATTATTLAWDVRLDVRKRLPLDDATQAHLIALARDVVRRAARPEEK